MLNRTNFKALAEKFTSGKTLPEQLWREIEQHYSEAGRHYHTLTHLEHVYTQLLEVKPGISDWETVLFTLFYHDVIYDPTAKDNEEQSAQLAGKRLQEMGFPRERMNRCINQILATKTHDINPDPDANYFTDADLSILGSDWDTYRIYMQNIRKEYAIYADIDYKPGRKKMLEHLLAMERVYKTDHFFQRFEKAARKNLQQEIDLL